MTYYLPRLRALKDYGFQSFKNDLIAGLIVALVALPLAMSFAISIGVNPNYGIYAAVLGGLIAALFGGSEFNVTGPTGAFVAILSGIVLQFGYEKLLVAGFLAGVILLLGGLFRFGNVIHYIPYPVVIGFTTGIGVIIFSTQLGNILGIDGLNKYEYFHQNMIEVFSHLSAIEPRAIAIALFTMIVMVVLPRFNNLIPSALIGVIASAIMAWAFGFDIQTIESVFGGVTNHLPVFHWPILSFQTVVEMLPAAFVIAMLGSIESLLSAVIADGMTRKTHDSNAELIGQGLANIVTPLFGGIPVTGAIARTAVNVKSGAATRLAAVFHSLFLLIVVLLLSDLVKYIPLAALGGVLAVVAYRMAELHSVQELLRYGDHMDSSVLVVTLLLTVFINITVSITVGLVLASLLFMKRVSQLRVIPTSVDRTSSEQRFVPSKKQLRCPHLSIYTIEGPLFFGAARTFINTITQIDPTEAIILRLKHVPLADATGLNALNQIITALKNKSRVYFSGVRPEVLEGLKSYRIHDTLGEKHIFKDTRSAINQALKDQGLKKGCEEYHIVD